MLADCPTQIFQIFTLALAFTFASFGSLFIAVYPSSISLISFIGSIQAEYLAVARSLR